MSGTPHVTPYSDFVAAPLDGGIRQPNFEQFDIEIDAAVAAASISVSRVDKSGPNDMNVPDVVSFFSGPFAGGDLAAYDALVAAHLGTDPNRGTDTHTFLVNGGPTVNHDETVVGVGGLPRYSVGDFILDPLSGPNYKRWMAADLSAGAAVWVSDSTGGSAGGGEVAGTHAVNTNNAIAVSTSFGPISYNVIGSTTDFSNFFTYSAPDWTCIRACRVRFAAKADYTVSSGYNRCGLRLDLRKNGSSLRYFDDDSYSTTSPDGQTSCWDHVTLAISDTLTVYCRSYQGRVDVWGDANHADILVLEDLG